MIDTLCLGGGGWKLTAKLGALAHETRLENIKTYVGVSMGGIVSVLLSVGYTVEDIYHYFTRQTLLYERDVDLFQIHKTYGIFTLAHLYTNELEPMIVQKLNKTNPTLQDIEEAFQKKVIICSWNLTKQRIDYHTGNTPIKDAIMMTTAIPFCLTSVLYEQDYHIDVGLLKSSLYVFNEMVKTGRLVPEETLCYIISSPESGMQKIPKNLFEFIQQVLSVAFDALTEGKKSLLPHTVRIKLHNKYPYIPIDIPEEERKKLCKEMWNIGYQQVKKRI